MKLKEICDQMIESGFGHDLVKTTLNTRLFRKASSHNLFGSRNGGEIIFSTEDSVSLIGRGDFCVVLNRGEYTGLYDDKDADAGKNYGYDEFRIRMSKDEYTDKIEYIVCPDWWVDVEIDADDPNYDPSSDPYEWIENLSEIGPVIPEREFEGTIDFNW
tara:strand:- start:3052 stop:3528 length:477 start_codon:yes stop_codon:yes gene_type:complete